MQYSDFTPATPSLLRINQRLCEKARGLWLVLSAVTMTFCQLTAVLVLCCVSVQAQLTETPPLVPYTGRYVILAPNTIRPGLPVTLSVTIYETERPGDVTLNVAITRNGRDIVSDTVVRQPGTSEVTLMIPPNTLPDGDFSLKVVGSGGLSINSTRMMHFNVDHFSIFVQSDKAIYKPGQTVRFRVMAVYPNLRPYTGNFSLTVLDANGNVIELWPVVQPNKNGIISKVMVMSAHPVLGEWTIKAEAEGQVHEYKYQIDEYVLPKFEVTITVPPYFDRSDGIVAVSVTAKYTYGKPVEGQLSLRAKVMYGDGELHRTLAIDGNVVMNFDRNVLQNLKSTPWRGEKQFGNYDQLIFSANVTESLTGIMQSADDVSLPHYDYPIKVVFSESVSRANFKPGLPYQVYLVVTHQDGSPLSEEERRQGLEVGTCSSQDCYSQEENFWTTNQLDIASGTGVVETFVPTTKVAERSIVIAAKYRGSLVLAAGVEMPTTYDLRGQPETMREGEYAVSVTKYLSPAKADSNTFIQVRSGNPGSLTIGTQASFIVESTIAPGKLTYQIVSRGNIIETQTIDGVTGTEYIIQKEITAAMSPKSKLIVYFLTDTKEVILDSLEFVVNVVFDNPVRANFSRVSGEPGDSVHFDVSTSPGAFVGILAIDKSVLLLADGNDITHSQVLESMGRFDTTSNDGYGYNPFRDAFWCFFPYYTTGSTAGEVLQNAGVIWLTDGNVRDDPVWFEEGLILFDAAPAGGPDFVDDALAGRQGATDNEVVSEKEIRKDFPETWLWVDTFADSSGAVSVQTEFPDTITSWVGTAISMDSDRGLGVTENPAEATVFKKFFVSLNLPYSVVRGEKFVLGVTVFNYLDQSIAANVQLQGSKDYVILNYTNSIETRLSTALTKQVTIAANNGATVNFAIEPTKNGMIELVVIATSGLQQDAVRQFLLVEPEGVAQEYTVSNIIDLSSTSSGAFNQTFSIDLPTADLVPDSVRAMVVATGDILGPTMSNLDQLLRMPSGCGEQTMIGFAPDVFIYRYLKETGLASAAIEQKALNYMKTGYQGELKYQHEDGSFSAWGPTGSDDGSTWLTAFVVRSFLQASPFIYIDPAKVTLAVQFLLDHQDSRSGFFIKSGRIIDQGIEGGVSSVETLTAYCAIAMDQVASSDIMSQETRTAAQTSRDRALTYLVSRLSNIEEDKYAMAISTYALALGGNVNVAIFRTRLDSLQSQDSDGTLRYWTDQEEQTSPAADEDFYYWAWRGPPSADIEMTAYGLLAYMAMGDLDNSVAIARWLGQQRNSFGGYRSTQDTVIGLLALSTYASAINADDKDVSMTITTSADTTYSQNFQVNNDNSIVLQQFELPVTTGNVVVMGTGRGSFLLSFVLYYNLNEVRTNQVFDVEVTVLEEMQNSIKLRACGRYNGAAEGTGMAIMDVGIPTGFYAREDMLNQTVTENVYATRYEIMGKSVIFYLNEIPNAYTCLSVEAQRANAVAGNKPSLVRVYSYYTPTDQTTTSYSAAKLSNTDICAVCPDCCGMGGGALPGAASSAIVTLILALLSILAALSM